MSEISTMEDTNQNSSNYFDSKSEERTKYEAYGRYPRGLGQQKEAFEGWQQQTFTEFLTDERFDSPESLVGYFVDHTDSKPEDIMSSLSSEDYQKVIGKFFKDKTHLSKDRLATEVDRVVGQVILIKENIKRRFEAIDNKTNEAIRNHLGYTPPQIDKNAVFLIPSQDVYEIITEGITTRQLKEKYPSSDKMENLGMVPIPEIRDEERDQTNLKRAIFIPMNYSIGVSENGLQLSEKTNSTNPEGQGRNWVNEVVRAYTHEAEHSRVYASYNSREKLIHAGFKTFPANYGGLTTEMMGKLREEQDKDEGMTDFITVWKNVLVRGDLNIDSTPDEIVTAVQRANYAYGEHWGQTSQIIKDMRAYQKEYQDADEKSRKWQESNVLKRFLKSYYLSTGYPVVKETE